jgi:ribonuclease BN (tRNA processing enzyme)
MTVLTMSCITTVLCSALLAHRLELFGHDFAVIRNVRVRFLRQPYGSIDGISLSHYHAGHVYELPASLAEYLVTRGFAFFEMRSRRRSMRYRVNDRRRSQ